MEALKKNKILAAIFLITLIIFVYFTFFSGDGSNGASISTALNGPSADQTVGGEILSMLAQMSGVKIDNSLFSDTTWISLRDFSVTLPTNLPGKSNIFAPIGQK